jgi:hypothetical protein
VIRRMPRVYKEHLPFRCSSPFFTWRSEVRVVHVFNLHVFAFLVPFLWCPRKNDFRLVFTPICFVNVCLCCLYLFVCIGIQQDVHVRWCSRRLAVAWWVSHVGQIGTAYPYVRSNGVHSWVLVGFVIHDLWFSV